MRRSLGRGPLEQLQRLDGHDRRGYTAPYPKHVTITTSLSLATFSYSYAKKWRSDQGPCDCSAPPLTPIYLTTTTITHGRLIWLPTALENCDTRTQDCKPPPSPPAEKVGKRLRALISCHYYSFWKLGNNRLRFAPDCVCGTPSVPDLLNISFGNTAFTASNCYNLPTKKPML